MDDLWTIMAVAGVFLLLGILYLAFARRVRGSVICQTSTRTFSNTSTRM
jgi:hypothetical protein